MTTSPTCIIAYTSEDERYDSVRKAALDTARASEARLILYDIDAAQMFAAPLPTSWSGEDSGETFGDRLTADDLERAGRHQLAEQVREACEAGVEAFGWLPEKKGADAMAEYADLQHADLIIMPAAMEEPGLFDRLRGNTVEKAVEATDRPIALVDDDGEVRYA
ncbi:MAG: universal stress protein [Dehalococcoidia bacterium]|nr:universal stress protein [Dehalococcoidia bacterium]